MSRSTVLTLARCIAPSSPPWWSRQKVMSTGRSTTGASAMGNKQRVSNGDAAQSRSTDDVLFIRGVLNFDTVLSLDEHVRSWITAQPATRLAINLAEVSYANSAAIA